MTPRILLPALLLVLWGLTACDRTETPAVEEIVQTLAAAAALALVTDFLGREISTKPYADRLSRAGLKAGITE